MKQTILLLFLMVVFCQVSYAQTGAGSKFVGGSFGIGFRATEDEGDNNSFDFNLQPRVGYFIQDNFAVGTGIGFSVESSFNKDADYKENTSTFFISPFARYYFPIVEDKFYIFGQGQLSFNFSNSKAKSDGEEISSSKSSAISLAVSPGFAFFPSENWSVELSFRGLDFTFTNPEGEDNNTTSIGLGLNSFSPSLGLYYFF